VQLLLGLDPELAVLPDMTANTPLHWACESGNAALVQQLLQYKPQLDMQNLNMCEYSTGQWLVGDDPIMPLDKVRVQSCQRE
jgi:ankyrin repeat protein